MAIEQPSEGKYAPLIRGNGWSECHCVCHNYNDDGEFRANHILPCCAWCKMCGRNISGVMEAHVRDMHSGQSEPGTSREEEPEPYW